VSICRFGGPARCPVRFAKNECAVQFQSRPRYTGSTTRTTATTTAAAVSTPARKTCARQRPASARRRRRITGPRRPRAPYIPFVKHKPHPSPPRLVVSVLYAVYVSNERSPAARRNDKSETNRPPRLAANGTNRVFGLDEKYVGGVRCVHCRRERWRARSIAK